jgi:hypothetical protein
LIGDHGVKTFFNLKTLFSYLLNFYLILKMTETGDHGGDSKMELETTLFFYSKKELFISSDNIENRVNIFFYKLI